jgi:hypothetical protein
LAWPVRVVFDSERCRAYCWNDSGITHVVARHDVDPKLLCKLERIIRGATPSGINCGQRDMSGSGNDLTRSVLPFSHRND